MDILFSGKGVQIPPRLTAEWRLVSVKTKSSFYSGVLALLVLPVHFLFADRARSGLEAGRVAWNLIGGDLCGWAEYPVFASFRWPSVPRTRLGLVHGGDDKAAQAAQLTTFF